MVNVEYRWMQWISIIRKRVFYYGELFVAHHLSMDGDMVEEEEEEYKRNNIRNTTMCK